MVIFKETTNINLPELSIMLDYMKINKLNIFSINKEDKSSDVDIIDDIVKPSKIKYIEIGADRFIKHINEPKLNFKKYNNDSLYILRNGSYIDVKNIINKINGYNVNIGRGGSQKAHTISPLDFRLSCYLMALYNFDYKFISYLNTFDSMEKSRYLVYSN